ncbi:MAG: aldo/keto reductase [Pseudomonadota bacterium]
MNHRKLGSQGLKSSALGLGCMGMSDVYGPADRTESIRTIHRALDLGISMLDTSDVYGGNDNERLIGEAIAGRRDDALLATKFGILRGPDGKFQGVNGTPEYARQACEGSLSRLGVDVIDLYYLHRVDPNVPIEDTMGALARLVEEGKVRFVGLSEANPDTIRRAHAVHPVTALQSEYSLWTRDPEDGVLPLLRELGIGFVAYSPLGRGILGGGIHAEKDLAENDYRRHFPRYQGDNLARNAEMVDALNAIASGRGITVAQLALAWVLGRGEDIVPIPGTKRRQYLEDNVRAADVTLNAEELQAIERAMPRDAVQGQRFPAVAMKRVNR